MSRKQISTVQERFFSNDLDVLLDKADGKLLLGMMDTIYRQYLTIDDLYDNFSESLDKLFNDKKLGTDSYHKLNMMCADYEAQRDDMEELFKKIRAFIDDKTP